MGSPILFRRLPPSSDVSGGFQEFALKFKLLNEKAFHSANDWGKLSAAFSGFYALARGGKEDKWNNIIGSGAAGAIRSRSSKCSKKCLQ